MLLTKKVACPSCSVKLKVADTLPAGKVITCPKCGTKFPVPEDSGDIAMAAAPSTEPRKAASDADEHKERTVAPSSKKKANFRKDEDEDQEVRPRPRKRRKRPQPTASNTPLILGLVIGGAVALLGGVVLVMVLRNKAEPVAANNPPPSRSAEAPSRLPGGPSGPGMLAQRSGEGERAPRPATSAPRSAPEPPPSESSRPAAGGDSDLVTVGQGVFQANNCARCHTTGGGAGGGRGRGPRGPDLSHVGGKPSRTVEWLAEQIRDPQSHRPDSRMPGYAGKISEDDIHALAVYLASLK